MTKGIVLCSFGKRGYAFAAYNFAFSIKHHNPNLTVAILTDGNIYQELTEDKLFVFDIIIDLHASLKNESGRFNPAIIKTHIYDILPFDENLFLDVDALAINDVGVMLDDLIADGRYFYSHILGTHKISDGNIIAGMGWAFADDIWKHYNLTDESVLPAPNSSFMFIRKCDESKILFDLVKKNISDPIDIDTLRYKWGGNQPDELYLAVALCQMGITGEPPKNYIFMAHQNTSMTFTEIQDAYPILCLWGNKNMSRPMFTEWYDRLLIRWHSEKGMTHLYKWHFIKSDKYANVGHEKQTKKIKIADTNLIRGTIPISETTVINSERLIQSYPDAIRRHIRVTNWLNCSMCEFDGKTYFAYRMESAPFCTRMKIGMCLLDENLQPIQSSNVLLELHSELKQAKLQGNKLFPKGFHVEDPRLFIFNNGLYLSYTDGYQMGQAKIDPATLQATESFYLTKPNMARTEKNWTFFENEDNLYSVYSVSPHTILEMNGSESKEVFKTNFKTDWKWGEIRGGTSPIKIGKNYLSFFHSAIDIIHKGQKGRQYFMGAYIFEGVAPFRPLYISKEPILAGEEVSQSIPRLSNKIFVVFPCGAIRKNDSWMVSFGYNDFQCRTVEVTDTFLKDNLIEIKEEINELI